MNSFFRIAFSSLLLLLTACRGSQSPDLAPVWDDLKENPDSVLAVLANYDLSHFKARKEKAEFALLKSIALDKNYVDVTSDSLIRIALDYFEKRGTGKEKMLCWYYTGRVYANAKDYNKAIVCLAQAEEFSKNVDDPYQKALISMAKENIYSHTHNYSDALKSAKDGARLFNEAGDGHQALVAKRRLAMDYIAVRDFANADSILLGIVRDRTIDSSMVGRCILNYAWSLALQERYAESLEYYHEGIEKRHVPLSIPQMEQYGVALYHLGLISKADTIRDMLKGNSSAKSSNLLLEIESLKARRNYEDALAVQRKLVQYEDSIVVQTLEQSLIKSLNDYQQSNSEMFRIRAANRKLVMIGIMLMSTVVILFLLILVAHLMKKHRNKEEDWMKMQEEIQALLEEANERNSLLEDHLTLARRQYISAYKQKFNRIAHLSETYYRSSGSKDGRETVYREVRELASFLTTDNRTYKRLEMDVNASLSGAMDWFRTEYIGLDEFDYRFVCYLMAGFPASTIGLLTGLSCSNVYVRKSRLLADIHSGSAEHRDLFLLVIK